MLYPYPQTEIYSPATQLPLQNHSYPGTLTSKKLLVMHITQGSTVSGAYNTFKFSVSPNRVSAHFIVDQDGKVYQLLPLSDIGFHASEVNSTSIGIEHVAIAPGTYPSMPKGLPPSEAQMTASAMLVKGLCERLGLVIDRATAVGHNQASPRDGHVGCCEPTLDLDKIVEIAKSL